MNGLSPAPGHQSISISSAGLASVVASGSVNMITERSVNMITERSVNMINVSNVRTVEEEEEEEDDEGMEDGDSYGEEEEDMLGVSEVTSQLAAAGWQHGPVGVAAAAAIASAKRKRKNHTFETNPSIRKRQQTRLLRKLKSVIDEFSVRVGQQAVVLVATPGKPANNYRAFGAKPLEDVVRSLKSVIMAELETALSQQAPPASVEDPTLHELPPIVIEGIPTPVEKMTQAQLRAFIPLMLKYSTGRGKPGWGKESTRPPWWPKHVPWANVRMDARNDEEKSKQISWTHALREIVLNCYKYHGRDDLLPKFTEEEDMKRVQQDPHTLQVRKVVGGGTYQVVGGGGAGPAVVQTISNPDGSVSIIQVDPNNPVITLPDGTTAQVQLHEGAGVHTLAEVATAEQQGLASTQEISTNEHGHILITGEDGTSYPVQVSGHQLVSVPVNAGMYQTVVANIPGGGGEGGHVQVLGTPIQIAGLTGGVQSLQGVVMKTEPGEHHSQGLTITPVSLGGQQVSVLQMGSDSQGGQVITMGRRSPEHHVTVHRGETPDNSG